eukprot:904277-Rhodomonas_salina.1
MTPTKSRMIHTSIVQTARILVEEQSLGLTIRTLLTVQILAPSELSLGSNRPGCAMMRIHEDSRPKLFQRSNSKVFSKTYFRYKISRYLVAGNELWVPGLSVGGLGMPAAAYPEAYSTA